MYNDFKFFFFFFSVAVSRGAQAFSELIDRSEKEAMVHFESIRSILEKKS